MFMTSSTSVLLSTESCILCVVTMWRFATFVFGLLVSCSVCQFRVRFVSGSSFSCTKPWCVLWLFTWIFWSLSLLFPSGDNILTALNVARTCGMMSSHEQIIFVHASPPTATSMALLRFNQGDSAAAVISTQETMDILEQVLMHA